MARVRTCGECGVPLMIGGQHTWHGNGVIRQTRDPDHRMVFFESENIDRVFHKIEEIIGVSVERIVVESQRRSTREYLEKQFPLAVRRALYLLQPALIAKRMAGIASVYGYGHVEVEEVRSSPLRRLRKKDDYLVMTIKYPYSIYRYCGDNLGGMEAVTGRACSVTWERLDEDTCRLQLTVGRHPVELEERLARRKYAYREGEVRVEKCPACGVPRVVARCVWDLENGTITDPTTGRRMALFGPASLDAAFHELESELGETIPETVIEAQRRFVKEAFHRGDWRAYTPSLEELVAARGLGMLAAFEVDERHLSLTICNSCLHLWMVGLAQGIFEMETGRESTTRAWSLAPDGELTVRVSAGDS
ncbi:MAG: hypothetical protein H5T73_09500 [Actinobacteria bacterium]|nr:hypothetical protein [Actinomycetota bacterium]